MKKKCTVCEDSALTLRSGEVVYLATLIRLRTQVQILPPLQYFIKINVFFLFINFLVFCFDV